MEKGHPRARLTLHPAYTIGAADRRLFGSFAEHVGRCVYGGLYEPGHPSADGRGFRSDVGALVDELGPTVVRYPGGNFVSGYRWEDGIGPAEKRPRRADLAWKTIETNRFGTGEFMAWCRLRGVEPMLAVNLGSRGLEDAVRYLEYCNLPGGTELSERRMACGDADPYRVRLWCLGNEMDGPWQVGRKTASEYGRLAAETAAAMRRLDPSLELVACGSSFHDMESFGEWERTVLDHCYDQVDYISLHQYYGNRENEGAAYLTRSDGMDAFIREVAAIADAVKAIKRSKKRLRLSFDEWNVWFHSLERDAAAEPWTEAPPLLEDRYTAEDAVLVGGMLVSLLNNADRVKIACLAQLVNAIAPIMTETGGRAWRQTIFHPFALTAAAAKGGTVLRAVLESDRFDAGREADAPYLAAAAVAEASGGLAVFAVNRSADRELDLEIEYPGLDAFGPPRTTTVRHDDPKAVNGPDAPGEVSPAEGDSLRVEGHLGRVRLPAASWNLIRFPVSLDRT